MKRNIFFLLCIISYNIYSQDYNSITIENKEAKIYELINEYRVDNGLSALSLSTALCYVADVHVKDLFFNTPHKACGSLNSWSDKGRWRQLCYDKSKTAIRDMKKKPAELTYYSGQSMEMVYYNNGEFTCSDVVNAWISTPAFNRLILNKAPYAATKWLTIGIAEFEGYVSVWLGPLPDDRVMKIDKKKKVEAKEITTTADAVADTVSSPVIGDGNKNEEQAPKVDNAPEIEAASTDTWYVIIAIAGNKSEAEKLAKRYREKGLSETEVIIVKSKYRISAKSFHSYETAIQYKKELSKTKEYKDAWVLKK
ncbi:MAG: SPOR domain-containing protein [Bacteroidales bacterium]|nr:SPOR domain-containing protein [Bacteroidales bacterium]